MRVKVSKWGNSLALRLPGKLAASHSLREGSEVELRETADGLLIEPVEAAYELGKLLQGITSGNRHTSLETGPAKGNEAW